MAILEPALERELGTADRERLLEVALVLSGAYLGVAQTQRCLTLGRRMLPLAEQLNDRVLTAAHTRVLGAALHLSGDWTGARRHFQHADLLPATAAPSTIAARTAIPRAQLLIWEGSWDDAERLLEAMGHDSRTMRIRHVERRVRALYTELDLLRGDPRAALPHSPTRSDSTTSPYRSTSPLAGRTSTSASSRGRELSSTARSKEAERSGTWLYGALALCLRGLIAGRQGDTDDAERAYQEGLRRVRTMPFPYGEQRILHACALLERQRGNHQAATRHLTHALEIAECLGATNDAEQLRDELRREQS